MVKKVAYIGAKGVPANFPGMGGIDNGVEKTAKELVKMGYQVTVFVRSWATPKDLIKYCGVNLIHLPSLQGKNTDTFTHSFLSSLYVCFHPFDIVCYRAVGSAFFSWLPRLFGRTVITTIHSRDWDRDKWGSFGKWFLLICEKISISSSNIIVVVSKTLKKRYSHLNKPVIVIPNGIDKYIKSKTNLITSKYSLDANSYLLYMGRFVPEKRIEWLIKAYKLLKPKLKLVLVGGINDRDKYYLMLKKLVSNDKQIIFLNYVFGCRKAELLSQCRLIILPSKLEGCSNIILDAIQYKQAILAADIPENKELINDEYFLFKARRFDDFCAKLKLLINRPKKVYQPKNIKFLTWKAVAQQYAELF